MDKVTERLNKLERAVENLYMIHSDMIRLSDLHKMKIQTIYDLEQLDRERIEVLEGLLMGGEHDQDSE